MLIVAAAARLRKPNNLARQFARLAASHQTSNNKQHRSGPKTAAIQYLAAPSSKMAGPNRAGSISSANKSAGHALSGRNVLRKPAAAAGSGTLTDVMGSFIAINFLQ